MDAAPSATRSQSRPCVARCRHAEVAAEYDLRMTPAALLADVLVALAITVFHVAALYRDSLH